MLLLLGLAACNFVCLLNLVTLDAEDYIEVVWATDSALVTLPYSAATGLHPAIPSASVTVSFVSRIPP